MLFAKVNMSKMTGYKLYSSKKQTEQNTYLFRSIVSRSEYLSRSKTHNRQGQFGNIFGLPGWSILYDLSIV